MTGFYKDYQDPSGQFKSSAEEAAQSAQQAAQSAQQAAQSAQAVVNNININNSEIEDVVGLQEALDGKVDDPQLLTDVPANALFTDTTYTNISSFTNDENYISTDDELSGGTF
jgi:type II secretory pathway pseudopilin PulG